MNAQSGLATHQLQAEPTAANSAPRSSSLWATLIWKEWSEHKWKTALVTLLSVGSVLLVGGQVRDIGIAVLISVAGGLFLAMTVVAGERTDGTQIFVDSLPIERWKLSLVRMTIAGFLCIVPLLASALTIQFAAPLFTNGTGAGANELWVATFLSCGFCLSCFYWITATTAAQRTPMRVGLLGTIVLLCWFAIAFALSTLRMNHNGTSLEQLAWLGPTGWAMHGSKVPPTMPSLASLFLGVTCVGILFAGSVASVGLPITKSRYTALNSNTVTLGPPRRSPGSSLAWLQIREVLPLCGIGAAMLVSIGFVAAVLFASGVEISVLKVAKLVETTALVIGIPWSVVIAVGTFTPNLTGRLHTFWRSQPIEVGEWYWSKYWLGAAVALLSIHLPVVILIGVTQKLAWGEPFANCVGYLLCPLAHLMVYSLGVVAAASIRRIAQAGALSMAVATLFLAFPVMPESPLSFLRYDQARIATTEYVISVLYMPTPDSAALGRCIPFLLFTVCIACVAAFIGAFIVRRDVAYRR